MSEPTPEPQPEPEPKPEEPVPARRMRDRITLALATAVFALVATFGSVAAADCRGNNQFNGGHNGPPKTGQNVCTK